MNKQYLTDALNNALVYALSHDKQLMALGASMDDLTLYPYTDDQGQEIYIKARFDTDKGKWIKPFYLDGTRYKMAMPKLTQKPLYNLPRLLGADVVYVVEGEKCADCLIQIGLTATTFGGATSLKGHDLTPLQGKKCVLWCDNDNSGYEWLDKLIIALNELKITYDVIDTDSITLANGEPLGDKDDCFDYVQSHFADGNDYAGVANLIERLPLVDMAIVDNKSPDDELQIQELTAKKEQLQRTIERLASLDDMELHLSLKDVSKRYGLPQAKILQFVGDYKQGALFPTVEPHPNSVTADELYNELYTLADNHIIMDEPLKVAFVLWVIFSYVVELADFAPIAWITAPEKACGKTTLLGLFERVVNKPLAVSNISPAVMYRVIESYKPTLLVDEIDTFLNKNDEALGIINAGHSKTTSKVARFDNDEKRTRFFDTFGAKVFCGIGGMKGTFTSRAIKFELRRKTNQDEAILGINTQDLPTAKTELIKAKIARWTTDNKGAIMTAHVERLPIADRDFNNWYMLLQIAHALGVYDTAKQACLSLCQVEHEPSLNEQLLMDIRDILGNRARIGTTELLEKLTANSEMQWQTYNRGQALSQYQLAKKLAQFGIKSKNARAGHAVVKHYFGNELRAIFDRYLPPPKQDDFNPFA